MNIDFAKPFMILKRKEDINVRVFTGSVDFVDTLSDISLCKEKNSSNDDVFDTINAIPFSRIQEKDGFVVNDTAGLKISSLKIENSYEISEYELLNLLPQNTIKIDGDIKDKYSTQEYASIVKDVIEKEIGQGEGANFVIPNEKSCKIKDFDFNSALSIYRSLATYEYGSYWSFIFFDGVRFLIGATPEAHIVVKNKRVKMHPISGTFRKNTGKIDLKRFKHDFTSFLKDEKEINELFMVVDEELKMMAKFCQGGGMIIGPLLREMSALIHTEYMLTGKTDKDIISLLRDSMFAATVMGSPIANASKIINKYEKEDRRFYSSTIALIGRDENSESTLDSPILIRTVEIDLDGNLIAKVGATLVRNSDPLSEAAETEAKIAGVFEAITGDHRFANKKILPYFEDNDEILELLQLRNQHLSKFWFFLQDDENDISEKLVGKRVSIIHNEDDFCFMIHHMLRKLHIDSNVVSYKDYEFNTCDADMVIVGPGPGNPNNIDDFKISKIYNITKALLNSDKKFISICLGHQILCKLLGFEVKKKSIPYQGIPVNIDLFGKSEIVGFYNTFEAKYQKIDDLEISYDEDTLGIHALRDEKGQFISIQFHAESILTQNGFDILKNIVKSVV